MDQDLMLGVLMLFGLVATGYLIWKMGHDAKKNRNIYNINRISNLFNLG